MDKDPFPDIEVGQAAVTEPIDGVELEIHGLAEDDAGPLLIQAYVENDEGILEGAYLFKVYEVREEEEKFIAEYEDDGQTHKKAEKAIEEIGGVVEQR